MNPAASRVLTATGTSATVAQAQSNLTFDGTTLTVTSNVVASVIRNNITPSTFDISGGSMFLSNRILTGAGTAAAPAYTFTGDTAMGLFDPATNVLGFATSGVERMRIDSTGQVGIGTNGPASLLDISGVNATMRITDMRTTGTPSIDLIRGTNPTFGADANTDWRIYNSGGLLRFYRKDTFTPSDGDAMVITDLGRVGIGTSNPQWLLDVSGGRTQLVASGTAPLSVGTTTGLNSINFITPAGSRRWGIQIGNAETGSGNVGSDFLLLRSDDAGTQTATPTFSVVRSTGNVGIATIAPRAGLGSANALDVSGCIYGRLPVTVYTSSNTLDLSANFNSYANSYIYLTNPAFTSVLLPGSTATTIGGTFFQLKNSTSSYLSVTLNATLGLTSPVAIAPSNAITLVVSPSDASRMLLF
jgi:hypothetical protein